MKKFMLALLLLSLLINTTLAYNTIRCFQEVAKIVETRYPMVVLNEKNAYLELLSFEATFTQMSPAARNIKLQNILRETNEASSILSPIIELSRNSLGVNLEPLYRDTEEIYHSIYDIFVAIQNGSSMDDMKEKIAAAKVGMQKIITTGEDLNFANGIVNYKLLREKLGHNYL